MVPVVDQVGTVEKFIGSKVGSPVPSVTEYLVSWHMLVIESDVGGWRGSSPTRPLEQKFPNNELLRSYQLYRDWVHYGSFVGSRLKQLISHMFCR